MVTRTLTLVILLALATSARADDPTPPAVTPPAGPIVFHVPPASMDAGKSFELDARVLAEGEVEGLRVEVQPAADAMTHLAFAGFEAACKDARGSYEATTRTCSLELRRRATPEVFGATVPGGLVQPPGITYRLVMDTHGARSQPAFATREQPHPVLVTGESAASRRADRLARYHGHTAELALRTDFTAFGRASVLGDGAPTRSNQFSDVFGSAELEYTSRPLTWLYAFRLGLGFMRGQRSTFERGDGSTGSVGDPGSPEPGLNYGYGELDLEVSHIFYVTPRLTLGASEAGFSAGLGAEATIGRPTSTHLALGVDYVSGLGAKGWLTFAWTTVPRFPMGLTVELTEHPSADANSLGSRLLYDLGFEVSDALTLSARVGYAQRATSFDGGFVVGLGGSYGF